MQRALAGLLLTIGLAVGSITLSCWWFQHTVLDPGRTRAVTQAVIDDPEVRSVVADAISEAIAAQVPDAPADLRASIAQRIEGLPDASFLSGVLEQAHARLVGAATGPVTVDPAVLRPLVDDAVLAQLGTVTWDVPTLSPLATARDRLAHWVAIGLALALAFVAAGFVLHPRRDHALRTVGAWCLGATAWQVFTAWVFPVVLLPKLTDNRWASLGSAVARAEMSSLIGVLITLAGVGVACIVVSVVFTPGRRASGTTLTFGGHPTTVPPGAPYGSPGMPTGPWTGAPPTPPMGTRPAPSGFGAAHQRPVDGRPRDEDGWLL